MRRAQLRILEPCEEDFGAMVGPPERKFCGKCEKHVHDLSAMTEPEARALLRAHGSQDLCVRYRYGADGRVRFRPRPRTMAFVAVLSFAMAACTPYLESDALDEPEAAWVCRDASGYAIDCGLVDQGVIPDAPSEPGEPGDLEPLPESELLDEDFVVGGALSFDTSALERVDTLSHGLSAEEAEVVVSCPLPRPELSALVQGGIAVESAGDRRKARRRERRAERKRRRRLRRH